MITDCAVYEEQQGRREGEIALDEACEASNEPGAFVWIDLEEPTADEFEALREEFGLHPLAIEDAVEAHERPKLEHYDDVAVLVLRTAAYDDDNEDVIFGEVMVFAGDRFVITVRHEDAPGVEALRERVDRAHLQHGTAGVVHALVDLVVDGYGPVVAGLQEDIDEVEEGLFSTDGTSTRRIYALGREVVELSRAVQPLVDPVRELAQGAMSKDDELRSYFRDVQDHIEKVDGWVAAQRELLSNLLQANLTQVTIMQNGDMRKISAWVAIVAVPTMVAGIYGMNFEHMPELQWRLGYPAVLVVILAACVTLYTPFKKSGVAVTSDIFAPGVLDGHVAIITGGGTGLGRASAAELLACGARVVIAGRRAEVLEEAASALGEGCLAVAGDIRDPGDAASIVGVAVERFGRLDLLVNNAGGQYFVPAEAIASKGWNAVWRLNVGGTLTMTRAAVPALRAAGGGMVVNVTLSPHHGLAGMTHSSAARAAVEAMTGSLAAELAADGIACVAVAAGHFETEAIKKYPEPVRQGAALTVPLGRMGDEREHAWLVALLASPLGRAFTGSVVTLDGARDNWYGPWPPPALTGDSGEVPTEERRPAG